MHQYLIHIEGIYFTLKHNIIWSVCYLSNTYDILTPIASTPIAFSPYILVSNTHPYLPHGLDHMYSRLSHHVYTAT